MRRLGYVFLGVFFSPFVAISEALQCFQCANTGEDGGACLLDYGGMINATKGTGSLEYVKNCTDTHTDPPFDRCFIEIHLGPKDEFMFYHRGCHDGLTFNKKVNSTRFKNLQPNNFTTCAKPPNMLKEVVCYSFCETDMCNGPQPEPEVPDPCENQSDSSTDDAICGVNSLHGKTYINVVVALFVSVVLMFIIGQIDRN